MALPSLRRRSDQSNIEVFTNAMELSVGGRVAGFLSMVEVHTRVSWLASASGSFQRWYGLRYSTGSAPPAIVNLMNASTPAKGMPLSVTSNPVGLNEVPTLTWGSKSRWSTV